MISVNDIHLIYCGIGNTFFAKHDFWHYWSFSQIWISRNHFDELIVNTKYINNLVEINDILHLMTKAWKGMRMGWLFIRKLCTNWKNTFTKRTIDIILGKIWRITGKPYSFHQIFISKPVLLFFPYMLSKFTLKYFNYVDCKGLLQIT